MKGLVFLGVVVLLSGCISTQGMGWGLIPQNTEVCPQGKDATTGACR
ncbi:Uncharacterised protein [Serratia quinivorans]|nr:hypothetical protein 220p1_00159 [Serratia entomophila]CAI1955760.1 Uncharacterised protein [Serratia quinivorans]CAI2158979.1 Uncharacterised protein [Serratia quinivorans]